ncbi:hypothetical protein GOODEAATRI_032278, partial [Goodea atripinnis]
IEFDQTADPLAQVTLPPSLLSGVTNGDFNRSSLSRINFMFFSSPNFFMKEQKGLSLNSYVVASSVGNFSIKHLKDPVKIEMAHLSDQVSSHRECVFWDFDMNKGNGGWNNKGCSVSKQSTINRTVCHCNHLTHFGVLMVRHVKDGNQESCSPHPEQFPCHKHEANDAQSSNRRTSDRALFLGLILPKKRQSPAGSQSCTQGLELIV